MKTAKIYKEVNGQKKLIFSDTFYERDSAFEIILKAGEKNA